MKTENEFNAYLSKKFRATNATAVLKVCDKITPGIPDFLIWRGTRSLAIESKFVAKLPKKRTAQLLKHTFSGPQLTMLETLSIGGAITYGLVGIGETKLMYLIPRDKIPMCGNWDVEGFFHQTGTTVYRFDEADVILNQVLP